MKNIFKVGDQITFIRRVTESDLAHFDEEKVHDVYGTFAITRDMEWTSRLFVKKMKEDFEEGVGTIVEVEHQQPAFFGEEVIFTATITKLEGNEVLCDIIVTSGNRIIANGKTGQKIFPKEKLLRYFEDVKSRR